MVLLRKLILVPVALCVMGMGYALGATFFPDLGKSPATISVEIPRAPDAQGWRLRQQEFEALLSGDHAAIFKCGTLCGVLAPIDQNAPVQFHYPSLRDPGEKLFI